MKRGHCLCRAVTFEYDGDELFRGHCHCESCRRQTASPFTTFMGVAHGTWRWTGDTPKVYASTPGVKRHFCGRCGAPVAYESDRFPDEIHFYASLLEDHADFVPQAQYHADERVAWLVGHESLPRE